MKKFLLIFGLSLFFNGFSKIFFEIDIDDYSKAKLNVFGTDCVNPNYKVGESIENKGIDFETTDKEFYLDNVGKNSVYSIVINVTLDNGLIYKSMTTAKDGESFTIKLYKNEKNDEVELFIWVNENKD